MATANAYSARCSECGKTVPPYAGWYATVNHKAVITHRECVPGYRRLP